MQAPASSVDGLYISVSQCQAIHARSCFPCQDTPDVKASVSFKITSPLQVIASGNHAIGDKIHGTKENSGLGKPVLYEFEQPIPIPSYLFAIASGDLRSAKIGPRSTVWSGPDEIEGCKWELEEDMEKFLEAAESIIFQYQWGTYNVLVLPPSFPYGGRTGSWTLANEYD
jgi:leukotriene-A4 hydrolase